MKSSKILSLGLSLCLASVMFTGCSEDEAAGDPAPAALAGTWTTGCIDMGNTESVKYTAVVSDGQVAITANNYWSDSTCTTLGQTKLSTFSVAYGEATTLSGVAGDVYNMDGTNGTFSITPETAASVTEFNDDNGTGICGFTDWAAGVAKTLTVANCTNDFHKIEIALETADFYDIASIQSDSKLYLGDTDGAYPGTTAALRPVALDTQGMSAQ